MAKPHSIRVGSKKRHAAGAPGVCLRFTALVSQGADGLSPIREKPDRERKGCLSLLLKASETERDKEESIGDELGDGLTISRRCWGEILERFIYAVDVMVTEGRDPTF